MKQIFEVNFAGVSVNYSFRYKKTVIQFGKRISISKSNVPDIEMNDEQFEYYRSIHPKEYTDAYVEYKGLLYLTSAYLLHFGYCMFHAVSFLYKGKVWLLSARSGTGKTTQYNNWNRIFPNEITMISGDMPLLDFKSERILVHPSPWNGKERIGNDVTGELGGIIFLRQGSENIFFPASLKDSIQLLFQQFTIDLKNEEEIRILTSFTERIENTIPLWIFENEGSERSTIHLRQEITKYIEAEERL